jgi:putative ABC transport system substrate-binding protein
MRRREFIFSLATVGVWPRSTRAQAHRPRPLIGWLGGREWPPLLNYIDPLLEGLRELGYTEGKDFDVVSPSYRRDRAVEAASELVQSNPDIIVAAATLEAVNVKKLTASIPIVVPILANPVGFGLVASEARPGGNLTGIAPYVKGLPAKQLELAREVVPNADRIGLLSDVVDPKALPQRPEIEAAANQLGLKIIPADVRTGDDIGPAYQLFATERVQAVIVEQSGMLLYLNTRLAELAATRKLPTVYGYREHVQVGGLISYGINVRWCFHRAAYFVDRILRGAKPADLPVEFPTKIELAVNLKAAKALGLTISDTILLRADEIIE